MADAPVPAESALSVEIVREMEKALSDGVFLQIERFGERHVTGVHWHPGAPSKLAETLIKECHGPLPVELDGHKYILTPVPEEG